MVGFIAWFLFDQFGYFTPIYYSHLQYTIGSWWGVPMNPDADDSVGHSEMVRPTFFFIFGVIPFLGSLLVVEYLRRFNIRRHSAKFVLTLARVLRRKPLLFGRYVSWFSFGELIFLIAFIVGGNIWTFSYDMKYLGPAEDFNTYLDWIGVTLGFSSLYNLALLLLPVTRNGAWMEFLNISYANAVKYHRWLGIATVVMALLHVVFYYWLWIREGTWSTNCVPCFDCPLDQEHGRYVWFNTFGAIAMLGMLAISATSIPYMRRKLYDVFYITHNVLFVIIVVFTCLHWGPTQLWILPPLAAYLISRAVSASNMSTKVKVHECTLLSDDLLKIVLSRSTEAEGEYKVGQFVYLNVPAISALQWHAFTIASSPLSDASSFTILLKVHGDWTKALAKHTEDCKSQSIIPDIYVDGFYGISLKNFYTEYPVVCLIGGGIGVTPLLAILEDLSCSGRLDQKLVFIFSFREIALLEEIHPVLMKLKELDPQGEFFHAELFLSSNPSDQLLDQPINHERLRRLARQPTQNTTEHSRPFFVAFQDPKFRIATYLIMFFTSIVCFVYLEYGKGKIKRNGRKYLWPLQWFVEITCIFLCTLFAWVVLRMERLGFEKRSSQLMKSEEKGLDTDDLITHKQHEYYAAASELHTLRDLVTSLGVTVGRRPDIRDALQRVYESNQTRTDTAVDGVFGSDVIGVFTSGPKPLKVSVERAVVEIGSRHFDVHEEEFEL